MPADQSPQFLEALAKLKRDDPERYAAFVAASSLDDKFASLAAINESLDEAGLDEVPTGFHAAGDV